ncbi:MAG: hypothetical protein ACUVRL_05615 [Candidatus Saccharicenans sp.]|uniref:hypothetical protein n=1 Tax=Candidatus Saccharicenans sp. TaxID=2819258 RepID=UPI00404B0765
MRPEKRLILSALLIMLLGLFSLSIASAAVQKKAVRPLRPGEEGRGPWWIKATALTPEGRLPSLKSRKWWKKTLEMKPGESLILEESGEARERMAVRLESYTLEGGQTVEVMVWAIDDDGNDSLKAGGDFHDDCYLYDLNRDGQVDLMIDYSDENEDGQADFMEVRYFERGYLIWGWFGYDFENIGELMKFRNPLELLNENFSQNLNGQKLYFKNVYDRASRGWRPAEVCPLASFDFNGDGLSDLVVRFNLDPESAEPVIGSLEVSVDVDRGNSQDHPFHYDLGLVLAGRRPYDQDECRIYSSKRRPPQEVCSIPHDKILGWVSNLEVTAAGFSWKEYPDERLEKNNSWQELEGQGIGWSWERKRLPLASASRQKWNVRRETASSSGAQVEFYYSPVDQKIHLLGAEEGWLPVGNLAGLPRVGEIRYFDTDGNGYFDRREIYLAASTRPVLVLPLAEDRNIKLTFDLNRISEFYLNKVLPSALARSEAFLQAMKKIQNYDPPPGYSEAWSRSGLSERRYLLDFISLMAFINLRDYLLTVVNQTLFQELPADSQGRPLGDLHPEFFRDPKQVGQILPSDRAWKLARLLTELEQAYGLGQVERFEGIIDRIKELGW